MDGFGKALNAQIEAPVADLPSTSITTQVIGNATQIESIPPFILAYSAYPSTR